MHGEDAFGRLDECRQRVLRVALLERQRRTGEAIGGREAGRVVVKQPAVVIAAHHRQSQGVETFRGLAWPQRAGDVVAQVDRGIGATGANVGDHRLEREQVGVNVGDDGEADRTLLWPVVEVNLSIQL